MKFKNKKRNNNDKRIKNKHHLNRYSKKFTKRNIEKKIKKHENTSKKWIKQIKSKKIIFLLVLAFIYIYFSKFVTIYSLINKKRVGVINLGNYQNVGTALVKYSVFKKLEEFGFNVTIIAPKIKQQVNIDFLKRTIKTKLLII